MTQKYVCLDNKFYTEDQPIFKLNRAMKFGDGVFETAKIVSGKVKYLGEHLARMKRGLTALEIQCSKGDIEVLKVCIEQLLIKNEIERGGILRIIAQRAGLGRYAPEKNQVFFYLETENTKENGYQLNRKGMNIGTSKKIRLQFSEFMMHKTLNAIPYILASKEKTESKFDELLLLNEDGNVVEGTASNIFIIKNGTISTPNIAEGCLAGVMRKVIIDKIQALGTTVDETTLTIQDIESADELFFTNATQGIRWASAYGNKRYFRKLSTNLIESL